MKMCSNIDHWSYLKRSVCIWAWKWEYLRVVFRNWNEWNIYMQAKELLSVVHFMGTIYLELLSFSICLSWVFSRSFQSIVPNKNILFDGFRFCNRPIFIGIHFKWAKWWSLWYAYFLFVFPHKLNCFFNYLHVTAETVKSLYCVNQQIVTNDSIWWV